MVLEGGVRNMDHNGATGFMEKEKAANVKCYKAKYTKDCALDFGNPSEWRLSAEQQRQ
jgi:hypothetical protein